jgi:two-component system phosphate regulon response regulator PhoB
MQTIGDAPYILVVEDDPPLSLILHRHLSREGYAVETAADGPEGMDCIVRKPPQLLLLDWGLPSISGLELCRRLRADPPGVRFPIVMMSARGSEGDRVCGLDAGADDFLVKPFSLPELSARIRGLLRRAGAKRVHDRVRVGGVEIDRTAFRVRHAGRDIRLAPTEYHLLEYMMRHPGRVLSRRQLIDAVWGEQARVQPRNVDVRVGALRKALRSQGGGDPIRTVRSTGYTFQGHDHPLEL